MSNSELIYFKNIYLKYILLGHISVLDTINTKQTNTTIPNKNRSCDNCRNCLFLYASHGGTRRPDRDGYYHAIANSHCSFYDEGIGVYILEEPCKCNCHKT